MKKQKIRFYLIITLIIFSGNYLTHSTPAFHINSRTNKYLLEQTTLERYSNNGSQIRSGEERVLYTCPTGFAILDFDITGDNQSQIIGVLFGNKEQIYLEIYNLNSNLRMVLKNMTSYQPWKIVFTDVDCDSVMEVCLGVSKKSPLHPIIAKRLFIYNFQQGLQPKWLGSRLARPFIDFDFSGGTTKNILVSLELDAQDRRRLNFYQWDSFGFTGIETGFNDTLVDDGWLSSGFLYQKDHYCRVLYVLRQNNVQKLINLDLEE